MELTLIFIGVSLGLFAFCSLAYEFWALAKGKPTISQGVWYLYKKYPPFGFLVGLLIGLLLAHFFWNM